MSHLNAITSRLSLRPPQSRALEILADVTDMVALDKATDAAAALASIREKYPSVADFERGLDAAPCSMSIPGPNCSPTFSRSPKRF